MHPLSPPCLIRPASIKAATVPSVQLRISPTDLRLGDSSRPSAFSVFSDSSRKPMLPIVPIRVPQTPMMILATTALESMIVPVHMPIEKVATALPAEMPVRMPPTAPARSPAVNTSGGNAKISSNHDAMLQLHCPPCKTVFASQSDLREHALRVHGSDRPFCCSHCNWRFRRAGNLRSHVLVHANIKPFNCDTCGRRFRQKSSLTAHKRIHEPDSDLGCNICGRLLTRKSYLRDHIRTVHPERADEADKIKMRRASRRRPYAPASAASLTPTSFASTAEAA